jgi:hypothetical protein
VLVDLNKSASQEGIVEFIKEPGGEVWVAEAPNWVADSGPLLKIAVTPDAIRQRAHRSFRYMVGQQYGVLGPGLIFAQHVFQGLKREAYVRDDSLAGEKKLAITWAAKRDAYFAGDAFDGRLEYQPAPENRVFVVYVSPNEMLDEFPSIFGWAEHWTWLAADPNTEGAPINWQTRYNRRIWCNLPQRH